MDILRAVSSFFRKLRDSLQTECEGSSIRLDAYGRMTVVSVGPGFDLRLRNVERFTVLPSEEGGFAFDIETADRETIARERWVLPAVDEIQAELAALSDSEEA